VPRASRYERTLAEEIARVRVEIWTDRGRVTMFVVQLEAWHQERWKSVRRYDTAHGQPHVDVLDPTGRTIDKQWLRLSNNAALTLAINDIKRNWRQYLAEFEGR
jgi:hypothetical protein